MLTIRNFSFAFYMLLFSASSLFAQKIGYVSSQTIREKFPEAKQAEQRLQTMVDNWKRELEDQQKVINELELEIKKNRLVWTEAEKTEKISNLEKKKKEREEYATRKLGPNGEYDAAIALVFRGVEEKIYAAIQEISFDDSYDIVWDKSTQPLAFINPKYDLTIKVLKKLGINVDDMEKQQKEAIDKDPRNAKKSTPASTNTGTKRTRSRKPAEVPEEEKKEEKGLFDKLKDSVMDGLQDMIKIPTLDSAGSVNSPNQPATAPTEQPGQAIPADTTGIKRP